MNLISLDVVLEKTVVPAARDHSTPSVAKSWLKAIELTARIEADPTRLLADIVEDYAECSPDRAAILSEQETFTYGELASRINRYARWALENGVGVGDTVCLLMPSRPEYLAAWLGITTVGGVVALINTQLVGASLAHCINVARARHLIVAAGLADVFRCASPHLDFTPRVWIHGGDDESCIGKLVDRQDGSRLSASERRHVTIEHCALLIFTSGTTGMPKAARVSHRRVLNWGSWFAGLVNATSDDRMYNCLPIYHSVGGVVATGSMLVTGGSVVLAEKFSAGQFWDDVVGWDCTLFQYIGELCRYLLKASPSPNENRHRLRLCCGNGLRGDVWEDFKARFAIPRILEFYAATEGNFSLYNVEGKPGAIGRIPSFLARRFPAAIVRFDADAGVPLRTAEGLCVACERGEAGEAIGRIGVANDSGGRFEGYTDSAETEKKILRNVFAPGDAWFRTGDLMTRDEQGYFHFVDRVGDTFRWKGETVAASEVAEAITSCSGVIDTSVYGVVVPGIEGRCGMAALVVDDHFDLPGLHGHLVTRLPAYARPLFIRIRSALDTTETFKQKKQGLISEGFDPHAVADPLYFEDAVRGAYVSLDASLHARIANGAIRL
jgi:fatty-acyl-CoA synthase